MYVPRTARGFRGVWQGGHDAKGERGAGQTWHHWRDDAPPIWAEMMNEFGIAAPLAAALVAKGYAALTPVQEAMLGDDVAGRDLLVSAQTGSGKTVAFGIAIADELLRGADRLLFADVPMALIVAPTRELALQVARELDWLYGESGALIATCVGGMDYRTENAHLIGARILLWARRGGFATILSGGRLTCLVCARRCWMKRMRCLIWASARIWNLFCKRHRKIGAL
jgi:hypothetical protein